MRKIALLICVSAVIVSAVAAPKLRVSENKRFLVTANGKPFFYLGDTAWELFHRLNREQADKYLEDRAKKGFTVIQAVALAELNGLNDPNPYGHRPLLDSDPSRPDVKEGAQNDYWDHVDYIVNSAEKLGLTIGFLPTWGDKWNPKWAKESKVIFTQQNAEKYGQWLAARYRDKPIIWILGGDRPVENEEHKQIIRAMAGGLRAGDGGIHLMTFHPPGGNGSSQWFHG
ncbi:MAG: apiosidase-like domain-containing protein, partial [Limisphaerales bacterium]